MGTLTYLDANGVWQTTDDTPGGVQLDDNVIVTRYIADQAVTTPKLADLSVTNGKIVSVDASKITNLNSTIIDSGGISWDMLGPDVGSVIESKASLIYQDTEPAGTNFEIGDVWFDTNDGNRMYTWNGTSWTTFQETTMDEALGLIDNKNSVFMQESAPANAVAGDTWFNSAEGNRPYVYNGSTWVDAQDAMLGQLNDDMAGLTSAINDKNKIYYTTGKPAAGIDGDMWIDTNDNYKIYVYSNGDYRVAPFGLGALDAALQNQINTSSSNAATALDLLADISADNKVTPDEKQLLKKEWDVITSELSKLSVQADKYFLNTQKTAYVDAFNALQTFLNVTNTVFVDLSTTSTITSGATMRTLFKNYYDARTDLLNAIYDRVNETAASAVTRLDEMSSDSKLSPVEKQQIKLEWDVIVSEKPVLNTQASTYGTSTENTAYNTKYSALSSYVTPLLANLTVTSDVDGPTLRLRFKEYYDSRTVLLNAIYAKVQAAADAAADAAAEANTAAQNAMTSANGKNRIFYQDTQPSGGTYIAGDTWFDTNDGNKIYLFDGSVWELAVDPTTAQPALGSSNKVYYSSNAPSAPTGGFQAGDLWFDSNDNYKIYVWNGSIWQLAQDAHAAQETANSVQLALNGKNKINYSTSQPSTATALTGDLWFDTDDSYKLYTFNGTSWQLTQDSATASTNATTALNAANSAVTNYVIEYASNSSETVAPSTGWSTTAPTRTAGTFIWSRTKITYGSGSTTTTNPVLVTGNTGSQGPAGAQGKGISSTAITYQAGTSGTTAPTGTWTTAIPSVPADQYLWTRVVVSYTDSTSSTSYSVGKMGAQGPQGNTGADGTGVQSTSVTYQAGSSGTTAPTGTWSSTIPAVSPSQYLWTRTVITYTDESTSTAYSVGMMGAQGPQGAKGETGATGATGAQGPQGPAGTSISGVTEYYLATSASSGVTTATPGWTTTMQSMTSTNKYLWNYEVINFSDGGSSPTVPVIIGTYGDTGATGPTGRSLTAVTEYYLASASSTGVTRATSGWTTTVQATDTTKKYLWNYEKMDWSSGTTPTYVEPIIIGVHGATGPTGVGVSSVTPYFLQQASATAPAAPTTNPPPAPWTTTEPGYVANTNLFRSDRVVYSNNTFAYTAPTLVSAYTAAQQAMDAANTKARIYYQTAQPSGGTYNTGDIWIDTDDNQKLYTYNGSTWQVSQDSAGALTAAQSKSKIVHSTNAASGTTGYIAGDLWIRYDGSNRIIGMWRYTGSAWQSEPINGTAIADATIGTAKIIDANITTAKIADLAVTNAKINDLAAGKINAGFLDAARIQVGSLNGDKITTNTLTASQMATGTITAASGIIADAAITTAKIADLAVTNAKIGSLDAGKITTGFLDAARIDANTITASKIFVGDMTNLVADGNFLDTTKANWTGGGDIVTSTTEPNKITVVTAASGNNDVTNKNTFQVTPGERIYAEVEVFGLATNVGGGTPNIHLKVTTNSGGSTWPQFASTTRAAVSGAWVKVSGVAVVPTNARTARVELAVGFASDAVGNTYYFRNVIARRMTSGELLVDGSVTANKVVAGEIKTTHLATNAVTADKILAGAVTTTKLDALAVTAEKIAAGAIISDKIFSGAVIADKIASNAVIADKIAANAITTDKIAANQVTLTKLASDVGQGLDISSNTSITSRVTTAAANNLISSAIDNIDIGGKNIVVDSGYMFGLVGYGRTGTNYTLSMGEVYSENVSLQAVGAAAGSLTQNFTHLLYETGTVGRNMVLSFFVKGSVAATGSARLTGMTSSAGTMTFPITTSWTRVVLDMGSITAAGPIDATYLAMWASAAGTFSVNSIKLEYGNKETEWSIAPQDIESQISGLSGRIESAEQVITSDSIVSRVRDASWYQADLSGKASTSDVAEINTLLTTQYSTIEQTSEAISLQFGQLDGRLSDVEATALDVSSSFTFGANGLLIAKSNSAFKVEITNNALNFLQGTTPIAWVNGNSMFITDATITNSLKIGSHTVSSQDGITTFRPA